MKLHMLKSYDNKHKFRAPLGLQASLRVFGGTNIKLMKLIGCWSRINYGTNFRLVMCAINVKHDIFELSKCCSTTSNIVELALAECAHINFKISVLLLSLLLLVQREKKHIYNSDSLADNTLPSQYLFFVLTMQKHIFVFACKNAVVKKLLL